MDGDEMRSRPHPWHVIAELDVARLVARHARLRGLCDRLEACADALPRLPTGQVMAGLRNELTSGLATDIGHERDFVSGSFGDCALSLDKAMLERMAEHLSADSDHAGDIVAAFDRAQGDLRPPSPETIGYMLRSFFDSCREGLAFEELAILELGRHRLTPVARDMLVACLERGRR